MEEQIIIKELKDYYKLYAIIDKEIENANFHITFEKTFLDPFEILIIAQFVIRQKQRKCSINVSCSKSELIEYFKAIDIVKFCNDNLDSPNTLDFIPSSSSMPICRVEIESMNEYINKTQTFFKPYCEGKDLGMLDLCLSELVNNVIDHSFSPIGAYVFCQYYQKTQEIKLAVSDLGIGIPRSVNTFRFNNKESDLSSKECVVWALKENMTTKSKPYNKGKGLDNVNSFMKANSCSWKLFTNDIQMKGEPTQNRYNENPIPYFRGTIVQLNIKIENLPNEEFSEEMDWY